ncbi:MAG: hypothetical protein ACI8WB_004955 [Phenylobacterium sp.]|jgi:hypothetical protein
MKNCKLKLVAAAVMLSLGTMGSVSAANDTSSSMRGKITGPAGNPAANVKVIVKHTPTGTVSEFTTNDTGTFIGKGLRVGGPYDVTIDSDKFQDASLSNVYLQLGDTYRLIRQLEADNVERIGVSAQRIVEATGSTSTFGQELVDNMPSLKRDMKDIARINPLATVSGNGNLTFAGGNPRMNSITVDGIGQNDDFGLNYEGYPTSSSPISLEAIAEISVSVVPFSVRQGGFSGGSINAVTKSGSNEFHGSVFYDYSAPDLAGKRQAISQIFDDNGAVKDADEHRTYKINESDLLNTITTMGIALGGPIIKDELFFFANYETLEDETEFQPGFNNSGAANEYSIEESEYNRFNQILNDVYGLQDSLFTSPVDKDDKWLLKLDWNISDNHRLAMTYQNQDNEVVRNLSGGGSSLGLASSVYTNKTTTSNISTKLYSEWSDSFTTEFGIAFKDVESESITGSDFGSVQVYVGEAEPGQPENGKENGRGSNFEFGAESNRHANESQNKNLKISFDANYLMGEHDINFGFEIERLNLYNLFAPDSKGSWVFESFDAFANQVSDGSRFQYSNAFTNDAKDAAYDNVRYTSVLYAEDTFYLTDDFEMTAGLRYELVSTDDKPNLNSRFQETYDISNQENLDGLDIFMPRVSFKWFAAETVTVRGGIGRFNGGIPNVWYNGPFTADGITYVSAPDSAIDAHYTADQTTDFTQVPQSIQDSLVQGAGSLSYIDPNFKLPSDWRAQLAVDYTFDIPMLGDGFAWTTELTYMKKKDEPIWRDASRSLLDENGSINYAADGERIIMTSIYDGTPYANNYDVELSNADKDGRSIIFTTALSKYWDSGVSMSVSYANQDVSENTGGTNSRNSSNYSNTLMVNRNQQQVGRGYYEIEHSFKLNLGYKAELFDGYDTRINLFYERRSGRPLSWVMGFFRDGDLGDQRDFNTFSPYLPYIPSGPDDANVDWENSASWDELSTTLSRAGVSACGCILDRGAATQPWVTELDLSFKQEIPGFMEGHKGQLMLTIENLANLLNDDWGVERNARFPKALYDFGGLSDDGKYQLRTSFNGYDVRNYSAIEGDASTWQIKLGVRYTF